MKRVTPHVLEEGAELLGVPHVHLRRHALGQVGAGGDVAREVAPAYGVSKCGMEHAVDVSHGLGCEPAASVLLARPGSGPPRPGPGRRSHAAGRLDGDPSDLGRGAPGWTLR
jgi:hypothetical protein